MIIVKFTQHQWAIVLERLRICAEDRDENIREWAEEMAANIKKCPMDALNEAENFSAAVEEEITLGEGLRKVQDGLDLSNDDLLAIATLRDQEGPIGRLVRFLEKV